MGHPLPPLPPANLADAAIDLTYSGFNAALAAGYPATISFNDADLARAAISVGDLNAFRSGRTPAVSALAQYWRTTITRDASTRRRGYWCRSNSYGDLEPTEKAFISGLLGGVISKMVAEKVFGIGIFGHLEYFPQGAVAIVQPGGRNLRPDFLGLTLRRGRYSHAIVVESKGRSGNFSSIGARPGANGDYGILEIDNARRQTQAVNAINGYPNITRYAQFTNFSDAIDRRLRADLFDPPRLGADDGGADLAEIDLAEYYRDVVTAVSALPNRRIEINGLNYRVADYGLLDAAIAVPEMVYTRVDAEGRFPVDMLLDVAPVEATDEEEFSEQLVAWWSEQDSPLRDVRRVQAEDRGEQLIVQNSIGPDGIVVVGTYSSPG